MSIMLLWTAYDPIAHTTTMSGVRIANGMRRIAAKKGTNASTIRTPMTLPVYMLAISLQKLPGVEHDAEVHSCLRPGELEPLLDGEEDLADPEEPDDRHDEVEALHE